MLSVYNYMGLGLAITGLVAYLAASTGLYQSIAQTPLIWLVMLAPLGFVFFLGAKIRTMSVSTAQLTFWAFAAVMGLSLAYIFLYFTGASVARVFFITAGTFGAMSLYGYTTKRDLSGMGSFLMMGLIGIIIAMVVNIFLQSSAIQFAVSVLGVLIFVGLTAYDTQKIKEMYYVGDDGTVAGRKAIMGALSLYLDFINMFMFMLHFFGGSNE
jgi:FtsH-binding integral membrane protein